MDIDQQTTKPDRIKLLTIAKKASKLLLENRVMESLIYYEQALLGLKDLLGEEQCKTDYQYLTTAIYREIAIAKFGDKSSLDRLERYRKICIQQEFKDLLSLCSYFLILSYMEFRDNYTNLGPFINDIYNVDIPEHVLPIKLLHSSTRDVKDIILLMRKVENITGSIEPFINVKEELYRTITPFDKAEVDNWYKRCINPIEQARKEIYDTLITGLDNTIRLCSHNCSHCGSICCYKEASLTEDEVQNITNLVKTAPYFRDIGDNFIIKDNTNKKYKTATVWSPDKPYNYPSHFTNTKCIFSLTNGDCALQRYAIDNGYHPWKFKPKACWLFPLTENTDITEENQPLVNPPLTSLDKDKDPNNLGEQYPGYVTYIPCVETPDAYSEQIIWYDKYIHEIEYLKLQKESED